MSRRYVYQDKVYYLKSLDMEREATLKLERYASKLDADKRPVFENIAHSIGKALKWERLHHHVDAALNNGKPILVRGNIYELLAGIRKLLQKIYLWVRRNQSFPSEKVKEVSTAIYLSARSICRIFDRSATCWQKNGQTIVVNHVG